MVKLTIKFDMEDNKAMSHIVGKSAYKSLEERLNRFPQGAPPSETLI